MILRDPRAVSSDAPALALGVALLLGASSGRAEQPLPPRPAGSDPSVVHYARSTSPTSPRSVATAADTDAVCEPTPAPSRFDWKPEWRRSSAINYAVIGAGFSTAIVLELLPQRRHGSWSGPILLDDSLRSSLVASTSEGRNRAGRISDIGQWGSVAHTVFDATFLTMWHHHAPDLGYEMLVMNAEAYAVSALLNSVTKRISGRERPDTTECLASAGYDSTCATNDRYASYYSGHTSITATSAGLTCIHHIQNPLYGSPWDAAACAAGITLTSFTGALRVVADRHWASDVITGHMVGFTTGYFLPLIFHYRGVPRGKPAPDSSWRRDEARRASPSYVPVIQGLLPSFDQSGARLILFGSL
ncbi:MAG TPA: phosphatase PAP2 family protein [Polyangiaceae bacterium]|nr:phosphatase PAP2 family protein [Polyangiaceae bacterium]